MKLLSFQKVKDGKYLKNYELTYENKAGKEKVYEIVSHRDMQDISEIGTKPSGISIVALYQGKMLLLREFRMGVNAYVYNLCAGMTEKGETIEETLHRELLEETGLQVTEIVTILPPAYAAVSLSDIMNQIAIVRVDGNLANQYGSDNEEIHGKFYTKSEMKELLLTERFSSRAQFAAYCFSIGAFEEAGEGSNV